MVYQTWTIMMTGTRSNRTLIETSIHCSCSPYLAAPASAGSSPMAVHMVLCQKTLGLLFLLLLASAPTALELRSTVDLAGFAVGTEHTQSAESAVVVVVVVVVV